MRWRRTIIITLIILSSLLMQKCEQYAKTPNPPPESKCTITNKTAHKIDIYAYYSTGWTNNPRKIGTLIPYGNLTFISFEVNCFKDLKLHNADSVVVIFDDSIKITHVFHFPKIASRPILKICYWNNTDIDYSYEFNEQDYEEAKVK